MTKTIVTTEMIMSWRPCYNYPEDRVRELVGDGLDARGIVDLDIPRPDKYWVIIRMLSDSDQRLLSAAVAERVLMRLGVTDMRSWNAIRVARLYAMDEADDCELSSALDAAWATARAVPFDAALEAADDCELSSAWGAARAAAWDARAAVRAAAWDAAIDDCLRLIDAAEKGDSDA